MLRPVDLYRELRASRLRERAESNLYPVEIVVFVLLIAVAIAVLMSTSFAVIHYGGADHLSGPVVGVVTTITLGIGGGFVWCHRSWRTRGTDPFAFPVWLTLPRWKIFRQDHELLVLTDCEALVCLIARARSGETLDQVLETLDPEKHLRADADAEAAEATTTRFHVDQGCGLLRQIDDRSYALVLGSALRCEGLNQVLAKARPRGAGEPPQKWPLLTRRLRRARIPHAQISPGK